MSDINATPTPCIDCGEETLGQFGDTPETRRCRDCWIDWMASKWVCKGCGKLTGVRKDWRSDEPREAHAEGCEGGRQVTRVVHCKREKYDVYIGRPSKWGNPFHLDGEQYRADVLTKYVAWLRTQPQLLADLHELRGKVLGCWCAPKPCHGDVLARLADEADVRRGGGAG